MIVEVRKEYPDDVLQVTHEASGFSVCRFTHCVPPLVCATGRCLQSEHWHLNVRWDMAGKKSAPHSWRSAVVFCVGSALCF